MKPPNTVIHRGAGGPVCGECYAVLPVIGEHMHVCLKCHPHFEFSALLDERELGILKETMAKYDMSAKAVIKKWIRLGQMTDHFVADGYELVFRIGDNEIDPLHLGGPKMAPMPAPGMHDGWETSPFNRDREKPDEYCKRGCGQFTYHPPTGECPLEPPCGGVDCKILDPGLTYHNTDTCPEKNMFVKERINPDPGDIRHGL